MGTAATCWTVIRGAAAGNVTDRDAFARRYLPVVRAYLASRWRGSPALNDLEDATQEVFVDCFRAGGALERADAGRPGGFRSFLFGVARNVALRCERRHARQHVRPASSALRADEIAGNGNSPSRAFDRAWACTLMRDARDRMAAAARDEKAALRVELLRLRFGRGLAAREIAERWGVPAEQIHRLSARAKEEFRAALVDVVADHDGVTRGAAQRECERLLGIFSGK